MSLNNIADVKMRRPVALAVLFALLLASDVGAHAQKTSGGGWKFAVSGDSRNCGDITMPAIAAGVRRDGAEFYWHLGDFRALSNFDEDYRRTHPQASIAQYLKDAWPDFIQHQLTPFGDLPVYLGIGNHELVAPKTRNQFLIEFQSLLDRPELRQQRSADAAMMSALRMPPLARTYYHWIERGVDFINLDNATDDAFDVVQLAWFDAVLDADLADKRITTIVVGMHEALPESLARGHSMNASPAAEAAGLRVYAQLLEVQKVKPVYVLASHSHFVMENVFNTPYWREHGGVLPGWIVGTAGAVRYSLPPDAARAKFARTHVYGYLLATVSPAGTDKKNPIHFEFQEVTEGAVGADIVERFGAELVHRCYQENAQN